jgi:class 3 adenylate cyclase/tetratricopeptide (TPR) repeat protein
MIACPGCGFELADDSAFCSKCGTRLAPAPAVCEERKTVTTLFCDLVAFTAMSEAADPEDVDRLLDEYFARATKVIESHGGTVEKFIGDAVVGVFGVPAVHEDDPERAVRTGLRILEALEGMTRPDGTPLQARCGVNTGEALVRLDVDPASGRGFLTGDAVNVAARLQAAAPPGGVVMGETTFHVAGRAFDCEAVASVTAKGKSAPVAAWLATAVRARVGSIADRQRLTPLVGREVELAYIRALFAKAVAGSSPQLALIVGEPGIGKSRLVSELLGDVDARPEMVTWRQGRCLPYGEGVTFWTLAEVVKAHAGILETDTRAVVEAKLDAVLPEGEDRDWFRQRLRALLGLEAAKAEREENFTAWLRFLEEVAARGPTVLVFEDLHWADDALLAFLEYFASHVAEVPLLLIATARPELFETHPSFAAASRVNRVVLEPLTERETETLVASLVDELAKDVRATIARQAEGNPFYAEESARLVRDTVASRSSGGESAVAATVQAVIAARLDALTPELKAALTDAAVVGEVFWDGALAALGERSPAEVDAALRELVAKQLVHRVRSSSMAGEREFAFGHALAREVAYGELPRAVRAKKHAAVAAWIEQKAGDRAADLAELIAHHYATALELARAAGDAELAASLVEPAVHYLTFAGDRAWALDVAAAERSYAQALEIAGPDSPHRSPLLAKWAKALTQLGRRSEAVPVFEEAIARLRAEGDVRGAAVAQMGLAFAVPDEDSQYLALADEAVAMLEADGPSRELVSALTDWHFLSIGEADSRKTLEVAERAMALSRELGLPTDAQLLAAHGCARCDLGDAGGVDDLKQALEICRTPGRGERQGSVFVTVGNWIYMYEGFQASLAVCMEGLDFARRRGAVDNEIHLRTSIGWASECVGDWDKVLDDAAELQPLVDAAGDWWHRIYVRLFPLLILVEMGRAPEAVDELEWLEAEAMDVDDGRWTFAGVSIAAAAARMALGDSERALCHLASSEAAFRSPGGFWSADLLPRAVRVALAGGDRGLAEQLAASFEPLQPLSRHAIVAAEALLSEAHGDCQAAADCFADAASRWHDFAVIYEESHALLGRGRCLVALGRAPEAAAPLAAAHEIFARLGAKPALAETDELIQQVASA